MGFFHDLEYQLGAPGDFARAYVIAHEIGHQYLGHVKKDIEGFAKQSTSEEMVKQTREIRRQKYGKATMANNLLKRMRYQNYDQRRKKEIEADSIGFVFYKKNIKFNKLFLLNKE